MTKHDHIVCHLFRTGDESDATNTGLMFWMLQMLTSYILIPAVYCLIGLKSKGALIVILEDAQYMAEIRSRIVVTKKEFSKKNKHC